MKTKNILSPFQMTPEEKLRIYREYQNDPATTLIRALEALRVEVLQIINTQIQQVKAKDGNPGVDSKPEDVARALLATPGFLSLVQGVRGLPGTNAPEPTDERLLALIKPHIPQAKPGEPGHTPTKEELLALIEPLVAIVKEAPDGLPGRMPTEEELIVIIKSLQPKTQAPSLEEIINAIEARPIPASRITGLPRMKGKKYLHGGGDTVLAGSNITVTTNSDGTKTISSSASAGNFSTNETPSGTINGSNVTFTVAHIPLSGTLAVYRNGARQAITTDYTLTGSTITFVTAPRSGNILLCDYQY